MSSKEVEESAAQNIRREGVIVKHRAHVFARVYLSDPSRLHTLLNLRRVISKHHPKGKIAHLDVDTDIESITPLLGTNNTLAFEYLGYPRTIDKAEISTPVTANHQPRTEIDAGELKNEDYIAQLDTTAVSYSEYVLLKTFLGHGDLVAIRQSAIRWARVT